MSTVRSDLLPEKRKRQTTEARLLEIRREAESRIPDEFRSGVPVLSNLPGYYGLPVLKAAPWKWEIPAYLFTGGAAGAAAVIAGVGALCRGDEALVRDARRLAAAGALASAPLLISDLGRPSRFLNMLRVIKPQSPMSVGSWTLVVFSGSTFAALLLRSPQDGAFPRTGRVSSASQVVSTVSGLALSTYTGVLIGATAIPVWAENAATLPLHFAASGLAAASSILQLAGHEDSRVLGTLGIAAAAAETLVTSRIEISRKQALQPLKSGKAGWITRTGALLSGPVPLLLRLLARTGNRRKDTTMTRLASASAIAGSVLTRAGWIMAGRASANDPKPVLLKPPKTLEPRQNHGLADTRTFL